MNISNLTAYRMLESTNMDVYTTNDPDVIMVGGKNNQAMGSRILIMRDGNDFKIYANGKLFSVSNQKETVSGMNFNIAKIEFKPTEASVLPILNLAEIKDLRAGKYSDARDSYMNRTGLDTRAWILVHDNFMNHIKNKTDTALKNVDVATLNVDDIVMFKDGLYEDWRFKVTKRNDYSVSCVIEYIPPECEADAKVGDNWIIANYENSYFLVERAKKADPKPEPVDVNTLKPGDVVRCFGEDIWCNGVEVEITGDWVGYGKLGKVINTNGKNIPACDDWRIASWEKHYTLIRSVSKKFKLGDTFRHNGNNYPSRWKGQEIKLTEKQLNGMWLAEVIKADNTNDYPVGTKNFRVSETELTNGYDQFFTIDSATKFPRKFNTISELKVGDILRTLVDIKDIEIKITEVNTRFALGTIVYLPPDYSGYRKIGDTSWDIKTPSEYEIIEKVTPTPGKYLTKISDAKLGDILRYHSSTCHNGLEIKVKKIDNVELTCEITHLPSNYTGEFKIGSTWYASTPNQYEIIGKAPVVRKFKVGDFIRCTDKNWGDFGMEAKVLEPKNDNSFCVEITKGKGTIIVGGKHSVSLTHEKYWEIFIPTKFKIGDKFSWQGGHDSALEAIVKSIEKDHYHSTVTKPNCCYKVGEECINSFTEEPKMTLVVEPPKNLTSFNDVKIGDLLIRPQCHEMGELLLLVKDKNEQADECSGLVINIGSGHKSTLKVDNPFFMKLPGYYRKPILTPVTKKKDLAPGDLIYISGNLYEQGSILRVMNETNTGYWQCEFLYPTKDCWTRGEKFIISTWNYYQKIS